MSLKDGTQQESSLTPPSVEELKLHKGTFIELHSLSRQVMNGTTGEVLGFDASSGRYMVTLDDEKGTGAVKIKPKNCRRLQILPEETRRRALETAKRAPGTNPTIVRSLYDALKIDPCCVWAHQGLAEDAQQKNRPYMEHLHRAIAHLYAYEDLLQKREILGMTMEFAVSHGEQGDLDGEAEWIEKALELHPRYIHALWSKASHLERRGLKTESLEYCFKVLECPGEDEDGPMVPQQIAMLKEESGNYI